MTNNSEKLLTIEIIMFSLSFVYVLDVSTKKRNAELIFFSFNYLLTYVLIWQYQGSGKIHKEKTPNYNNYPS